MSCLAKFRGKTVLIQHNVILTQIHISDLNSVDLQKTQKVIKGQTYFKGQI